MAGSQRGGSSMRPKDGRRSKASPVARQLEMPSDSDRSTGSKYRRVPIGRTESSASHQATTEESTSSDGDVGVDLDTPDPLATESGDMEASDGSRSTSSNISKRKKSGRGPGKVPEPTAASNRPVICPTGEGQWEFIPTQPKGARPPNHVIGSLLRKHFPGLSKPGDDDPLSPGLTWEHYLHNKDEHDVTMATRVINAFFQTFSCVDGEQQKAIKGIVKSVRKILSDTKHTLQYKVVMQCRPLDEKGEKMTRKTACQTNLSREEYLSVVKEPWMKEDCWEALVDMWCDPAWQAQHVEKGNERAKMPGPAHVQGSRNLTTLKQHMDLMAQRAVEEEQRRQAEQESREKEREDTNKRLKLLEDQLQVEHYLN
ncbi:hypothetical protein VPH35_137645 [Triticum aestivum]